MKTCPLCGKGSRMGGKRNLLRGKYNPTKHVRKYPNLQWARLPAEALAKAGSPNGKPHFAKATWGKRIKICTTCLKNNRHLKEKMKR